MPETMRAGVARRPDVASLVAGVLVALFGLVLLLDATGTLDLRFAALAPLACLVVGATLLASGLTRRG
jgi:hypothetical protein